MGFGFALHGKGQPEYIWTLSRAGEIFIVKVKVRALRLIHTLAMQLQPC